MNSHCASELARKLKNRDIIVWPSAHSQYFRINLSRDKCTRLASSRSPPTFLSSSRPPFARHSTTFNELFIRAADAKRELERFSSSFIWRMSSCVCCFNWSALSETFHANERLMLSANRREHSRTNCARSNDSLNLYFYIIELAIKAIYVFHCDTTFHTGSQIE